MTYPRHYAGGLFLKGAPQMYIEWPQAILLGLMAVDLAYATAKHGEPRGNYDVFGTILSLAIVGLLLNWGGFFL